MGWRFWRRERSAAELSLERLQSGQPASSATPAEPASGERDWDADAPFSMPIEDVFAITGRGTVVTGRIAAGTVAVGQQVELESATIGVVTTTVTAIEMFRRTLDRAGAGDNVGLLISGVDRRQVARGDSLRALR